jgi:hypothetical protein
MAAPTMYEPGFRRANTLWKAPGVYFYMHQTSSPYHIGAGCNRHFGGDLFLPTVLQHLILAHWAMYHVESNSDVS